MVGFEESKAQVPALEKSIGLTVVVLFVQLICACIEHRFELAQRRIPVDGKNIYGNCLYRNMGYASVQFYIFTSCNQRILESE